MDSKEQLQELKYQEWSDHKYSLMLESDLKTFYLVDHVFGPTCNIHF